MSKVSVFLKNQDPAADAAPHRCSRRLAASLSAGFPRLVAYDREKSVLRVLTGEAWSSVKARVRPKGPKGAVLTDAVVDSGYAHPWSWRPTGIRNSKRLARKEEA